MSVIKYVTRLVEEEQYSLKSCWEKLNIYLKNIYMEMTNNNKFKIFGKIIN